MKKIHFFWCTYWYQNSVFKSFGYYWAGCLLPTVRSHELFETHSQYSLLPLFLTSGSSLAAIPSRSRCYQFSSRCRYLLRKREWIRKYAGVLSHNREFFLLFFKNREGQKKPSGLTPNHYFFGCNVRGVVCLLMQMFSSTFLSLLRNRDFRAQNPLMGTPDLQDAGPT